MCFSFEQHLNQRCLRKAKHTPRLSAFFLRSVEFPPFMCLQAHGGVYSVNLTLKTLTDLIKPNNIKKKNTALDLLIRQNCPKVVQTYLHSFV